MQNLLFVPDTGRRLARRARLVAVVVLAWSGLLLAGPRLRAQLSASSGAVEVTGGTGTRQITSPGTYFLSADLVSGVSTDGIEILASNVTLDLNGHTVSTVAPGAAFDPTTLGCGIYAQDCTNVTVRNGHVNGFEYGFFLNGGAANCFGNRLEDLSLDHNTASGVFLLGGQNVVSRCAITHTGGSTQPVGLSSCGVLIDGPENRVLDCDVGPVTGNASYGPTFGIFFWLASTDSFAWQNRLTGMTSGIAYDTTATGKYARNLVGDGVGVGFSGGTDAGGNYADCDGNGINDTWELRYFGYVGVDPNADPDGDGLTNWQEYLQGSDPNDPYNGSPSPLVILSGGDQRGAPGTVLPLPLSVAAFTTGQPNAPMHFAVTGGPALLSATGGSGAAWSTSVDVRATTPVSGGTGYAAAVFVQLAGAGNSISTVTVTPTGDNAGGSVTTTEIASNPNPTPPTGFALQANSATTADLTWTPSDLSLPVVIQRSADGGGTWQDLATFAAGATAGRVYHLAPDVPILLRAVTGSVPAPPATNAVPQSRAADGPVTADAAATDAVALTPLSVSAVVGEQAQVDAFNWSYAGAQAQAATRYLREDIDIHLDFPDYPTNEHFSESDVYTPPDQSPVTTYHQDATSFFVDDYDGLFLHDKAWVTGETDAQLNTDGNALHNDSPALTGTATLSGEYTLAAFVAAVEGAVPGFTGERQDGSDRARIALTAASPPAPDPSAPPYSPTFADPNKPFANGYDHEYVLQKLQYQFRCNQDPNGVVVYDVVFTPEDGGAPVHDVRSLPTKGKTLVPDEPLTLDPTKATNPALLDASQPNGRKNGTYQVVPIQLQPDDWSDDEAGGDNAARAQAGTPRAVGTPQDVGVDDPGQSGVKGDLVPSILPDKQTKHFVSPKATDGSTVRLRAQLPRGLEDLFDTFFEWVKPKDAAGNEVGTADGRFFDVPRNATGKYTVGIRAKLGDGTVVPVDQINVWIVWAYSEPPTKLPILDSFATDKYHEQAREIIGGYCFLFTINPPTIITDTDHPNLEGANEFKGTHIDPPGATLMQSSTGLTLAGGAVAKWDVSRRIRTKIENPYLYTRALLS